MEDRITITQPSQQSSKHTGQLRAIYFDSFPPHVRVDFAYLLASIAQGGRWLFAATRDDDLLGMAIVVPHVASDFHLLEYLAVARDTRSAGIGSMLLQHIVARMRAQGDGAGMFIEVESDDEGDPVEKSLRARRIGFYKRHGARMVECAPDYRAPLADSDGTMRMKLLWLAINENAPVPHGAKLRECLRGILVTSYQLDPASPLIQAVLEDLMC